MAQDKTLAAIELTSWHRHKNPVDNVTLRVRAMVMRNGVTPGCPL